MTVLSAQSILKSGAIIPCLPKFKRNGVSGGLSAATYDVSIAETIWMWPGRFKLASTIEQFDMPYFLCAMVHDKSTWARRGLAVQCTFIDPGWKGYLTLELTMHAWNFIKILKGTPIAQIKFEWLDKPTEIPYSGKYQTQEAGPQEAREE